jgi:hypothetical protein
MRRLSSSSTFFYKRVFPFLWVGFLLFFIAMSVLVPPRAQGSMQSWQFLPLLVMPLVMLGVGYFVYRKMIGDLIDEVWLDGDTLVMKNRGDQWRVALSDVMNINATSMTNPRRVTVMSRVDTRHGRDFSFIPDSPRGLTSAFKPDPIAAELIARVDALRGMRR